ncbi:MAG TPA: decarboxylating 6-phosphogluconate dehydrogenase [Actinomycetota bacterium]|nr:decarboxylating 6-phosphogluconate dehydrogenase [Actinomycetota bacterium]
MTARAARRLHYHRRRTAHRAASAWRWCSMQIGMVGLGRMGANMAERLRRGGHDVVGYDVDPDVSEVGSLDELAQRLAPPRAVWIMVPAGDATETTIDALAAALDPGDVVVDGGNSNFRDSMRRAASLGARSIAFLDAGTSGGVWGLEAGYCLMVGGDADAFARVEPALATLAPEGGYARVGPAGAGHFTKMVHNGIEYGLMQAYAEGFEILASSRDFELDLARVAELWRHGSVVRSWLLDLAASALAGDPRLDEVAAYVEDSGEGRWTVLEAIAESVPAPVISAALFARFASRQEQSFALRMVAALRREFGGHAVRSR